MHNAKANIASTRRGALKTGPHAIEIAPVKIIVFPQYSATVPESLDAEKIGGEADSAAHDKDYSKAAKLYLRAVDALPDRLLTKHRSLRTLWSRRARQCEQWAVVQNQAAQS